MRRAGLRIAVLAALDLTSAILETLATGASQPPAWAITLLWAVGVLTLVAIIGLWRGRGWVIPLIYVTPALDLLSGLLGLLNGVHDPAGRFIVKFVLGLAVIVVLIAAQVSSAGARR